MIAKSIRSQLDTIKHGSCEAFGCCFKYLGQPIGKYMMFSLFATNLSISHIVYNIIFDVTQPFIGLIPSANPIDTTVLKLERDEFSFYRK